MSPDLNDAWKNFIARYGSSCTTELEESFDYEVYRG
jgi:hypothetical protein